MGRGVSMKQRYNIQYRGLKKVQRELAVAGVPTVYKDRELNPPGSTAFRVHYTQIGPASNGEMAFLLVVRIGTDVYGGSNWNSGAGLARLKREFRKAVTA